MSSQSLFFPLTIFHSIDASRQQQLLSPIIGRLKSSRTSKPKEAEELTVDQAKLSLFRPFTDINASGLGEEQLNRESILIVLNSLFYTELKSPPLQFVLPEVNVVDEKCQY